MDKILPYEVTVMLGLIQRYRREEGVHRKLHTEPMETGDGGWVPALLSRR